MFGQTASRCLGTVRRHGGSLRRVATSNRSLCRTAMHATALTLLLICSKPSPAQTVEAFFNDFTAEWIRGDPNLATSLRYFQGEEQDQLDRQLTPLTPAYELERIELAKQGLARLRNLDRAGTSRLLRASADLLERQLQFVVDAQPFLDYGLPPLNQFLGANTALPSLLMDIHPIASERDAENYVAKLGLFDVRMSEAIAEAQRLEARGIIPPRFILDATIKQMYRFVDPSPGRNPLATTLEQKMSRIDSISGEKRAALLAEADQIIAEQVYPAWRKGIELLETQIPRATDQAGLSRLEGGREAYAHALRFFTTTDLTADAIHEIGLNEVARIEAEMDGLFRKLGRTEGSIAKRMAQLRADRMYPDPGSEESRAQVIADIIAIVRDAEKRSETLFDIRPKSSVEVQPTPTFREGNSAAGYNAPPPDGSRPGIYQYPRRLDNMSKVALRSVTYHETVPGHHFQLALQIENKELPAFRQTRAFGGLNAFIEGWALYAERLVVEEGWYEGDPEGLLDALDSQLFRARRLVVDTGLHTKGWTRQQAIDYGIPVSEVERYVVWPGQACSYMIGQLKIVELREKAKNELGEKFSLREFHNLVLTAGAVPLDLLEQEVDAYIASQRGPG